MSWRAFSFGAGLAAIALVVGCDRQIELLPVGDGGVADAGRPCPVEVGGVCVDPNRDPLRCGSTRVECGNEQHCLGGQCRCRPGLTDVDGSCVDLQADRDHCGAADRRCEDPTPVCAAGVCAAACGAGTVECNGACVDTVSSPLHCGGCGNRCERGTICVAGACASFRTAATCAACPCEGCASERCCGYPGLTSDTICVSSSSCP